MREVTHSRLAMRAGEAVSDGRPESGPDHLNALAAVLLAVAGVLAEDAPAVRTLCTVEQQLRQRPKPFFLLGGMAKDLFRD